MIENLTGHFQVKEYFTFEFMIWVGRYYNNKKISLDEAEKIFKYNKR